MESCELWRVARNRELCGLESASYEGLRVMGSCKDMGCCESWRVESYEGLRVM